MYDAEKAKRMDSSNLEVFAGVFESEQAVEDYVRIVDGKPNS